MVGQKLGALPVDLGIRRSRIEGALQVGALGVVQLQLPAGIGHGQQAAIVGGRGLEDRDALLDDLPPLGRGRELLQGTSPRTRPESTQAARFFRAILPPEGGQQALQVDRVAGITAHSENISIA